MVIQWQRSTEKLPVIVSGIRPDSRDYILAIGGSGDQAFSMLEFGARVLAVDKNPEQVSFIEQKVQSIQNRDYSSFLNRPITAYYFDREMLELIRNNLSQLEVVEGDIIDVCQERQPFTKIYLSNAVSGEKEELRDKLRIFSRAIPYGGLVYAANGNTIIGSIQGTGLLLAETRTVFLKDENWDPVVLVKCCDPD